MIYIDLQSDYNKKDFSYNEWKLFIEIGPGLSQSRGLDDINNGTLNCWLTRLF